MACFPSVGAEAQARRSKTSCPSLQVACLLLSDKWRGVSAFYSVSLVRRWSDPWFGQAFLPWASSIPCWMASFDAVSGALDRELHPPFFFSFFFFLFSTPRIVRVVPLVSCGPSYPSSTITPSTYPFSFDPERIGSSTHHVFGGWERRRRVWCACSCSTWCGGFGPRTRVASSTPPSGGGGVVRERGEGWGKNRRTGGGGCRASLPAFLFQGKGREGKGREGFRPRSPASMGERGTFQFKNQVVDVHPSFPTHPHGRGSDENPTLPTTSIPTNGTGSGRSDAQSFSLPFPRCRQ